MAAVPQEWRRWFDEWHPLLADLRDVARVCDGARWKFPWIPQSAERSPDVCVRRRSDVLADYEEAQLIRPSGSFGWIRPSKRSFGYLEPGVSFGVRGEDALTSQMDRTIRAMVPDDLAVDTEPVVTAYGRLWDHFHSLRELPADMRASLQEVPASAIHGAFLAAAQEATPGGADRLRQITNGWALDFLLACSGTAPLSPVQAAWGLSLYETLAGGGPGPDSFLHALAFDPEGMVDVPLEEAWDALLDEVAPRVPLMDGNWRDNKNTGIHERIVEECLVPWFASRRQWPQVVAIAEHYLWHHWYANDDVTRWMFEELRMARVELAGAERPLAPPEQILRYIQDRECGTDDRLRDWIGDEWQGLLEYTKLALRDAERRYTLGMHRDVRSSAGPEPGYRFCEYCHYINLAVEREFRNRVLDPYAHTTGKSLRRANIMKLPGDRKLQRWIDWNGGNRSEVTGFVGSEEFQRIRDARNDFEHGHDYAKWSGKSIDSLRRELWGFGGSKSLLIALFQALPPVRARSTAPNLHEAQ